jgi:peptidoglycan hydrolase CwlO-like protein
VPARRPFPLRVLLAALLVVAGLAALPGSSVADLHSKLSGVHSKEGSLQASINADSQQIQGFQGRIDDLQARLDGLQSTIVAEQTQLAQTQRALRTARARLVRLYGRLAHDRSVLASQLVARYEAGPPNIVSVLFSARGFSDLLETVDDLKRVGQQDTQITHFVANARTAVHAQTIRYAALEAQQERQTTAVLTQRDEVAQIKLTIVRRQESFISARSRKSAQYTDLHAQARSLQHQLALAQARAAAAQAQAFAAAGGVTPPKTIGSFSAHGGEFGFFQAPGTNYAVGVEPVLAARLDALGKALHLHLIGLSGYRTPQHSVEVGGFADDPHTKGEASDTPGVEGVSEATLNEFGLTRPFPGAAEADHIQLLGSAP